jgi:hypothetical protein
MQISRCTNKQTDSTKQHHLSYLALWINVMFCKKAYPTIPIYMNHFRFNIWGGTASKPEELLVDSNDSLSMAYDQVLLTYD